MSEFEHRLIPHSEALYRNAALFYFKFDDGKYAGVSNSFTPEQENIPYTGFIWERETIVPLLCPKIGDIIYDYHQNQCIER